MFYGAGGSALAAARGDEEDREAGAGWTRLCRKLTYSASGCRRPTVLFDDDDGVDATGGGAVHLD